MQFAGKIGILAFVLLVSISFVIVFGSGLLVGRQFPAHHYERYGNSTYLLDSATGKVCELGLLAGSRDAASPSATHILGVPDDIISTQPPLCNK